MFKKKVNISNILKSSSIKDIMIEDTVFSRATSFIKIKPTDVILLWRNKIMIEWTVRSLHPTY